MDAQRSVGDVQDERLTIFDLAVPVEFYPWGEAGSPDSRWGLYAAPRVVFQTLDDRLEQQSTDGSLIAGVLGVAGRWRFFAVTGELNLARAADMGIATTSGDDWHLLPVAGVRVILPMRN